MLEARLEQAGLLKRVCDIWIYAYWPKLVFESAESDRLSEYDIKLMDIDQEHLAIPETEYAATVEMPSAEFQRICRDLNALSESGSWTLFISIAQYVQTWDSYTRAVTD